MRILRFIEASFLKKDYRFEIFQQLIFLRNLAILQRDNEVSGDYIYEMLVDISSGMKSIYIEMLRLYRIGKEEEAFDYVARKVGGRLGTSYARLLEKLDRLTPSEMISQIESFQEVLREERISESSKMVERHSLIATVFATAVIFTILLNFIVVVVMQDTMRMIRESF